MPKNEAVKVTVINQNKLSDDQQKQFDKVLKSATQDSFLGDDEDEVIRKGKKRMVIVHEDGNVAGFYSPYSTNVKGTTHWRAGALYLMQNYRGRGIMESVLKEFFDTHTPGISWIDDKNAKSIALFKKLGFEQSKDSPISLEAYDEKELKLPAWVTWANRA